MKNKNNIPEIEKVAIVKCPNYQQERVDKSIEKALSLINFKFKKNSKVLIKPNVVGDFPKNQIAITTNPAIIEAVCKILKRNNCKIFIGDSSFTNPETAFKLSGIEKVAKKYGKLVIFEQDKLIKIKDEKAKVLRQFEIAKIIKNVDLIINIPKLKTHMLTKFTGAIKNLYGCIPGGMKQKLHAKAIGEKKFSKLLIDIYQNIKPELNIMDGIIGMEGNGPTSGNPKKAGLILASKNAVALDIVSTKIIGLKPKRIYAIKEAIKRKLLPKFEIIGTMPLIKFKKAQSHEKTKIMSLLKNLSRYKPIVVDEKKCIKCGICAKHCSTQAITLNPFPTFNRKKCIRCFCCIEVCPQHALSLKE